MVQGVSYEAYSDTLVVATFGRGIVNSTTLILQSVVISRPPGVYTLPSAKQALAEQVANQQSQSCSSDPPAKSPSSAKWLPPQKKCSD